MMKYMFSFPFIIVIVSVATFPPFSNSFPFPFPLFIRSRICRQTIATINKITTMLTTSSPYERQHPDGFLQTPSTSPSTHSLLSVPT